MSTTTISYENCFTRNFRVFLFYLFLNFVSIFFFCCCLSFLSTIMATVLMSTKRLNATFDEIFSRYQSFVCLYSQEAKIPVV